MATIIIEHRVKDYATWKQAFDAHADARRRYQLTAVRVYQDAADPNLVCVLADGSSEGLGGFATDHALLDAMESAGVRGEPHIQVLQNARITATT